MISGRRFMRMKVLKWVRTAYSVITWTRFRVKNPLQRSIMTDLILMRKQANIERESRRYGPRRQNQMLESEEKTQGMKEIAEKAGEIERKERIEEVEEETEVEMIGVIEAIRNHLF